MLSMGKKINDQPSNNPDEPGRSYTDLHRNARDEAEYTELQLRNSLYDVTEEREHTYCNMAIAT